MQKWADEEEGEVKSQETDSKTQDSRGAVISTFPIAVQSG
jgi:hypothetical protein